MKKKIYKRLLAIGLSMVMMMGANVRMFASNVEKSKEALIIEQAIALDENLDLDAHDYKVVTTNSNDSAITRSVVAENEEKVIRYVETVDDITKVATIVPFKCTEDGELVNSFAYTPSVQTRNGSYQENLVNVTLYYVAYFTKHENGPNGRPAYRHIGIEGHWVGSGVSVSELNLTYTTIGELYNKSGSAWNLMESGKTVVSSVTERNLAQNDYIFDTANSLPASQAISPIAANHCGFVEYTIKYSIYNGGNITPKEVYDLNVLYTAEEDYTTQG